MEEENKEVLEVGPCVVAWKIRFHDKFVPLTVRHVSRELSRAVHYFLKYGREVCGKVKGEKYRPSPFPKGGLEIALIVTFKMNNEDDDNEIHLVQLFDFHNDINGNK